MKPSTLFKDHFIPSPRRCPLKSTKWDELPRPAGRDRGVDEVLCRAPTEYRLLVGYWDTATATRHPGERKKNDRNPAALCNPAAFCNLAAFCNPAAFRHLAQEDPHDKIQDDTWLDILHYRYYYTGGGGTQQVMGRVKGQERAFATKFV